MLADLIACGSYPMPNVANWSLPQPPKGAVTLIITKQCKNYQYSSGVWTAIATDPYGAKYALQTSQVRACRLRLFRGVEGFGG